MEAPKAPKLSDEQSEVIESFSALDPAARQLGRDFFSFLGSDAPQEPLTIIHTIAKHLIEMNTGAASLL